MDPLANALLAILLMIVSSVISIAATWHFARQRAVKDLLEEGTTAVGELEALAQNAQDLEQSLERKRDETQQLPNGNANQLKQVFCEMLDGHRLAARSLIESVDALKVRWEVRADLAAPGAASPTQVYEVFRTRTEASRERRREQARDFRGMSLLEQLRETTERSKTVVPGVERTPSAEPPETVIDVDSIDFENPDQLVMYSLALDRQGKLSEALSMAARAYSIAGTEAIVAYQYADLLTDDGQSNEARKIWEKLLREGKPRAIDYVGYARTLRDLGDLDAALTACDTAIQLDSEFAVAYHAKASILTLKEAWEEALEAQNKASALQPGEPLCHYNAAVLLYHLKRFKEALAEFGEAARLDSSDSDHWYGKAYIHSLLGHTDAALDALDKSISLDATKKMQAVLDDDFDAVREHPRFKELTRIVSER